MENSDLAEADINAGPPAPFRLHDQGGEGMPNDPPVIAEAAPVVVAGHTSPASGTITGLSAEDSVALVRLLMDAAQQISNGTISPTNAHVSAGNAARLATTKGDAEDEEAQAVPQSRKMSPSQRDEVQLVEIRNPEGTGLSGIFKAAREYDEEEIGYYKDDIDTLLVFAGLYSAVLSAFIIESYTFLQPDPEDKMIFLIQNIVSQNYTMSNGFLNATNPYPALPKFEAPTWAIRVNVLWFSSLIVSLIAALYGMLVKQWLREYLNMLGIATPLERLRARQFRRSALDRWMVFEIAASLPLLLEIAFGLFFVGLCYFTTAIHSSISRSTILFVAGWAFFFLVATIAPLLSPRCPFKTTILGAVLRRGRKVVLLIAKASFSFYHTICNPSSSIRAYFFGYTVTDTVKSWHIAICACARSLREHFSGYVRRLRNPSLPSMFRTDRPIKSLLATLDAHMEEETVILKKARDDIAILQSVEEIIPGDGLLPTLIYVASAANPSWRDAFALMKTIIDNRTGRDMNLSDPTTWNDSLQLLSQQSCDALTSWISHIISCHQTSPSAALGDEELSECTALFCSLVFSHTRPLPELCEATLHDLIFRHKIRFSPLLFRSDMFKHRIQRLFSNSNLDKTRIGLSHAEWAAGAEGLILECDDITDSDGDIRYGWVADVLVFLVSEWQAPSSRGLPKKARLPHPFTNRLVEKLLDGLCSIERRGRIWSVGVDVFYGILLGGATSQVKEWLLPSKLFARNLTSICMLDNSQPYIRGADEGPTSAKKAFLTLMKSHSEAWMATLLGWLAPGRMPGNILAEIVAADLAACEPDAQRCKMDDIIHICQIASLEISPPDSYSTTDGIDLSTLLQIVILLQRNGVLDGKVSKDKMRDIQTAFRTAVIRRNAVYRMLMILRVDCKDYEEAVILGDRMCCERLDLVYAMSYGCYRESGWAGVMNRHIRESDWGKGFLDFGGSIEPLRFVVGDAWIQQEQLKANPKVPTRRESSRSPILPAESDSVCH